MKDDEIFDIVDDNDNVIGQASRSVCHGNPELIHRAVHVLVFNDAGNLLLQKRSLKKDIQPGRWDTSVGGHLEPGEDYLSAAHRETEEELGVHPLPLTFLYRSKIRNELESENIVTFMTTWNGPFTFRVEEISEIEFWSPLQIEKAMGSGQLTPNFEEEWRAYCYWSQRSPDEKRSNR